MNRILWAVSAATLLLITSCQSKKKGTFSVSGTFKNADKLTSVEGPISKVYLMEVGYGKDQAPVILDSAKLPVSNGSFSLSGLTSDKSNQQLFEVVFGNNIISVPLINDVSEVRINLDFNNRNDFYTISNSGASNQLKGLIDIFGKKSYEVEKTMAQFDSLKAASAPDTLLLAIAAEKNKTIDDLNTYLKQVLNTSNNPTIGAIALSMSMSSFTKSDFESSLADQLQKYPNSDALKGIKQNYDRQVAQMNQQQYKDQATSWVGKQAPVLALPDASGKIVSLASFKGKYLLVDFWASWCAPCRAENPNVVKAYSEFKGKNFAILGVSLDKEKDAWQQAIREDQLSWTHVSDLKYWQSDAVKTFGFEGIPYNVLIDPQGKVIAEGLRGDELESKLKEVLN